MQPKAAYPRVVPYLNYVDTRSMIDWLAAVFGMVERHTMCNSDGIVTHAEMILEGDGLVMLGSPGGDFQNPAQLGQVTQSLYITIDDVDAHCARSRAAGAAIIEDVADQPYGARRYGVRDPEGHHWFFASPLQPKT